MIHGGGQERKMRAGTENVPGIVRNRTGGGLFRSNSGEKDGI